MKIIRSILFAGAFAAAFGLTVVAVGAETHQTKTKTGTHTASNAKAPHAISTSKANSNAALGKSETLTGTLYMVNPAEDLVVVRDSGNIPFDFTVTKHTKILVNMQTAQLASLSGHKNDQITVQFVPRDRGDFASTIQMKAG